MGEPNAEKDDQPPTTHFSHPHALQLNRSTDSWKHSCAACNLLTFGPAYRCSPCNFSLHLRCYELPQQDTHFSHPHPLQLLYLPTDASKQPCAACKLETSGATYTCSPCNFSLHLRCYELPQQITHFSHPHPLQLLFLPTDASKPPCAACKLETSGAAYTCSSCNFSLHLKCYRLPRRINHPFHQSHILFLHSKPVHPEGQFRCTACSAFGDGFSYHCRTCGIDLHPTCASLPLKLSHQCHDHDLSLTFSVPHPDGRFHCDLCNTPGSKAWFYRCNDCEFHVDLTCLADIIPPDGPVCNYAYFRSEPCSATVPSFIGRAGNEEEFRIVRAKALGANVDDIEDDAKIHREVAVCLVCYSKCQDDNNIFKTKCRCKFSLIHETCASNWCVMKDYEQKCRLCDQISTCDPVKNRPK